MNCERCETELIPVLFSPDDSPEAWICSGCTYIGDAGTADRWPELHSVIWEKGDKG